MSLHLLRQSVGEALPCLHGYGCHATGPFARVGTFAWHGGPHAFAAEQLAGLRTWHEPDSMLLAAVQGQKMHDSDDDAQPRRRRL